MAGDFYDDKEAMPSEKRKDYYNEKIRWVVDYAYKNAPAVKEKLDKAGVRPSQVGTMEELSRIPITRVPELLEAQRINPPFGGFIAVPPNSLKRIFMAMGPEIYAMGHSGAFYDVSAKAFYAAGVRKGDILINAMPYHPTYAGWLPDIGAERLGATIIPAGPGNTELKIEAIKRIKPKWFLGTSSFFMAIIKMAEELGYNFSRDFSIRHACFGGDKLDPALRKLVEEQYKISVADIYGVGGVGTVAYECSQKNGMHIPEELIVEIVEPDSGKRLGPGEPGEVVVTVFDEYFPLIRLGTGDLAAYTDEPCPCGRTSNRITAIMGRTGEAIKIRALFLHPNQLEEAIVQIPQISRFQAIVSRQDHNDILTLSIEMKDGPADNEKIQEMVKGRVHEICRLKVNSVKLVSPGTIPEGSKRIVDERVW